MRANASTGPTTGMAQDGSIESPGLSRQRRAAQRLHGSRSGAAPWGWPRADFALTPHTSHRDRAARLRGQNWNTGCTRIASRSARAAPGHGTDPRNRSRRLPPARTGMAWHAMHPGESAAPIALPPGRRPAWLLHEPRPLAGDAGGLHCGGRLQLLHGPERIGSGWWHEEARRDYLVAPREHDCALCWAFHDRSSRRWFLQVFSAELGTATATITPFDLISIVPHRDWHA